VCGTAGGGVVIAVYGATGYTGQQIARKLVELGHPVTLAGRTQAGLETLADQIGGSARVHVAALDDRSALTALATEASVIVNCAGPFIRTCRPVAEAAIAGRAHYVDISGEQHASRWCYENGDALARAAGVALLPSFGIYSVFGDLLATRACASLGPIAEVDIAHCVDDWWPIGTSLVARFEAMGREWFEHDQGVMCVRRRFPPTTFFDFPAPIGRRRVCAFPMVEVFTTSWHIDAERITTRFTTSTIGPRPLGRFLPVMSNAAGALMRTPARPLVERAVAAMWHASPTGVAKSDPTRFMVAVDARGKAGKTRTWARGRGIYDISAPITAQAAVLASEDGFELVGTVAPAQVFDLDSLFSTLEAFEIEYGTSTDRTQ
jgi:short subunit dehydrogenase-like uncharacterized protein